MVRALQEGLHTLPWRWRMKIWTNQAQVDVTAVMLRVLSLTMSPELDGSESLSELCVYMHMYVCMCVYIYIYVCVYTQKGDAESPFFDHVTRIGWI